MICPSCKADIKIKRDTAYYCGVCDAWFTEVDGKWITIPEPAKVTEPEPKPEPKPKEPAKSEIPDLKSENKTRSYLFGLITVTTNYMNDEDENES